MLKFKLPTPQQQVQALRDRTPERDPHEPAFLPLGHPDLRFLDPEDDRIEVDRFHDWTGPVPVLSEAEIDIAWSRAWQPHHVCEAIDAGVTFGELEAILDQTCCPGGPIEPRSGRQDPRAVAGLADRVAHLDRHVLP